MIHLRITAVMSTPTVGVDTHPSLLDGPLYWAFAQRAKSRGGRMAPTSRAFAPDLPLPLAKWERGDAWGWCVSRAHYEAASHTALEVRRKPEVPAMVRFGADRKMHIGTGPWKARDSLIPVAWMPEIWWDADVTDPDDLEDLLRLITHIGARHRAGSGQVAQWSVNPGPIDGWRDRPMPDPSGRPMSIRAPHWHPTRSRPCTP